jgi:hypothetical protein
MLRNVIFSLFILPLVGCAHSTIVPFQLPGEQSKAYPPSNPKDVGIYRSEHPFASFVELGVISYRMGAYDLLAMYNQLRLDSGKYGAQAVVDVKVTKETHAESVTEQQCTPTTTCDSNGCSTDNVCHSEQVLENVSTFLITGSMIREKP